MNRIHLCFAAALAVGFGASPAYAEILIGSATPVTGKMAWFGEQHQRAVELAVSELNAAGGILGEAVEVVAVIQVWAQAVERAGTFASGAVAEALHTSQFDTVLGRIGFDENGDVTGYDTYVWYVWRNGDFAPALDLED